MEEIDKSKLLQLIKKHFPFSFISAAYAYGSYIFPVKDTQKSRMLDLLFIVPDLVKFHRQNYYQNKQHYSYLDQLMKKSAYFNGKFSQIYYNQNININGKLYKYGVIQSDIFKDSLKNWSNFFICGRFQKPVLQIFSKEDYFERLINLNRHYAFNLACLMNDYFISKPKLYLDIIELSYLGDIRNLFLLEDQNKRKLMLLGSFEQYDKIYKSYFDKYIDIDEKDNSLRYLKSDLSLYFNKLPVNIKLKLGENLIYKNAQERKKRISRLLKAMNFNLSFQSLLLGFYSSPDINYIINKYKKQFLK